jgi:hypothetical protein
VLIPNHLSDTAVTLLYNWKPSALQAFLSSSVAKFTFIRKGGMTSPLKIQRLRDTVEYGPKRKPQFGINEELKFQIEYLDAQGNWGEEYTLYGAFQAGAYKPYEGNGTLARFMMLRKGTWDVGCGSSRGAGEVCFV